jgi:hypothetical protein
MVQFRDEPKRGGALERNIFTRHEEVLLVRLILVLNPH